MNAAEQARSVELAQLIASALNQFRQRFPELKPNLRPWRDDPQTRAFAEGSSLDLAFICPAGAPAGNAAASWFSYGLLMPSSHA